MHPPSQLTSSVRVVKRPDRGRCLETCTKVEAGTVILAESPVCWWVDPECQDTVCAHCMETISPSCTTEEAPRWSCGGMQVRWCCGRCQQDDDRHAAACGYLAAGSPLGTTPEDVEAKSLLYFVAHATALRRTAPAAFAQLWSLMLGTSVGLSPEEDATCGRVAELLQRASPADAFLFDVSIVRLLCMKDRTANFAVMLPAKGGADGEMGDRRVRGYATYPRLSLANHSCLPTVARFDHFDGRAPNQGRGLGCGLDAATLRAAAPRAACVDGLAGVYIDELLAKPPHSLAQRLVTMHALPSRAELYITYMRRLTAQSAACRPTGPGA